MKGTISVQYSSSKERKKNKMKKFGKNLTSMENSNFYGLEMTSKVNPKVSTIYKEIYCSQIKLISKGKPQF